MNCISASIEGTRIQSGTVSCEKSRTNWTSTASVVGLRERQPQLEEHLGYANKVDDLVKRTQEVSAYEKPPAWSLHTYRTWLGNEKCIEETECEFIDDTDDLAYLGRLDDVVTSWLDYTLCRILPRKSKVCYLMLFNLYVKVRDEGLY